MFRRRAHRGRGGRAVVAGGVVRRTARRRGDGDGRSGCASAATRRPVMMTAAEVAVSAPCAQACTASTRQVATSATQRTATQAPEVCGTASSDRAPHTPAATPTDAVVTPTAFVGVAQALRAVMCPAAPARVSSAPVVNDPPGEEARLPCGGALQSRRLEQEPSREQPAQHDIAPPVGARQGPNPASRHRQKHHCGEPEAPQQERRRRELSQRRLRHDERSNPTLWSRAAAHLTPRGGSGGRLRFRPQPHSPPPHAPGACEPGRCPRAGYVTRARLRCPPRMTP